MPIRVKPDGEAIAASFLDDTCQCFIELQARPRFETVRAGGKAPPDVSRRAFYLPSKLGKSIECEMFTSVRWTEFAISHPLLIPFGDLASEGSKQQHFHFSAAFSRAD